LHEISNNRKTRLRPLLFLLLAFLAGCLCTGLFLNRYRFAGIGKLNKRYDREHAGAAETVRRLEEQLERERDINRQLREHNSRARSLAQELANSSERNVRDLQGAVSLIREIRAKLKVLEDFYVNSDTGNSVD